MSTQINLSAGQLLLSEPFMEDPNFKRSVVVLCEHKEEGTLGFIINKCLNMNLAEAIPDLKEFEAPLYFGGPVETDTLHFIHTLGEDLEGSLQIAPGLWWGGNFEVLSILIKAQQIKPEQVRFYLGYSGWSPGQLAEELDTNSWIPHPGSKNYIFNQTDMLWRKIMREKGGKYKIMSNYPEDPRLN
jgi:putative transcriptional regulator